MNNTLVIHVGMMKTGTTALQQYLYNNAYQLENYGWSYPVIGNYMPNEDSCFDIKSRSGNGHFLYDERQIIDTESENWNKGWETILTCLEDKNVIVSSELIMLEETERFLRYAAEKYHHIKVLIYLRRQDRWAESCYNESVKTNRTFERIEEWTFIEEKAHYLPQLNMLSEIVGKENLIVRVYEKQQLVGGDIVMDFLSVLGIPIEGNIKQREMINPSIRGNYFEIKRLINSVHGAESFFRNGNGSNILNWDMDLEFADICWKLSQAFEQNNEECGFFTPEERKEYLGKYSVENEEIAKRYLNRENGVLFYDDRMDYPMYRTNQYGSFEADMIHVFSAMIYEQNWKFQEMIHKMRDEIFEKILIKDIVHKIQDRKLLFFGAGCRCRELMKRIGDISVALIADNDMAKDGMVLNEVPVRYAQAISEWSEYFVVVTCEKVTEIERQLCGYGLRIGEDYLLARAYGV